MKAAGESGRCLFTTTHWLAGSVREYCRPGAEAAGELDGGGVAGAGPGVPDSAGVDGGAAAVPVDVGLSDGVAVAEPAVLEAEGELVGTAVPDDSPGAVSPGLQAARAATAADPAAAATARPNARRLGEHSGSAAS